MSEPHFVVVVDDDQSVRKALGRLLRIARMDVETYASGELFLISLQSREPDCLVLDIRMPGMTGPELRARLIAMGRRIPIVYITAHSEDEALERGASGIPVDVLRKPFDDEELLEAIGRCTRPEAT